jgi:hypothetical protein
LIGASASDPATSSWPRPDRLLVQPGDLGHQDYPIVPRPVRLDGSVPPPFGCAESAQQQVHLLMLAPVRVLIPGPVRRTLADLDVDRA